MRIAKRVFLFLIVNVLIVATISIVLSVLNVQPYLTANGIDFGNLMVFCLIWGFGGAFISLGLSRIMAKWMMGVKVIDPATRSPQERWLVERVHQMSRQAGLTKMPEVGVYESPEVNAFATGPTKSRALVAVSSGLLGRMDQGSVEGVLAHEVAHVANGDMVTMTLVQGVVNAFTMFLARAAAFVIGQAVREEDRRMVQLIATIVLDIAFSFLGFIVVAYFSRLREFRADAGGARLAGRERMVAALESLRRQHELVDTDTAPQLAAFKINGKGKGLARLFSTHPPLEERIRRLQAAV